MFPLFHEDAPIGRLLRPLTATVSRRRMTAIAASSFFFFVFFTGFEVVMPLWVTGGLGYTASEWALMRSLRMIGLLAAGLVLGVVSDRYGQKLVGGLSMVGAGLLLGLVAVRPDRLLWTVMPFLGAMTSTCFVNFNTLTQLISRRRQGVANTVYRSIGKIAAIGAPIAVTTLAVLWGGYRPVLLLLSGVILVGGAVLFLYPGEATVSTVTGPLTPVSAWRGYAAAFRERELVSFLNVSILWTATAAAVGTFAAIRFTKELGMTGQEFGALSSLGNVVGLAAMMAAGAFFDRFPVRMVYASCAVAAGCFSLALGASDSRALSSVAYVCHSATEGIIVIPMSIWISRAAGRVSQVMAFSAHKILQGIYIPLGMVLLGVLERPFGMRALLAWGGGLGVFLGLGILKLAEPAAERQS